MADTEKAPQPQPQQQQQQEQQSPQQPQQAKAAKQKQVIGECRYAILVFACPGLKFNKSTCSSNCGIWYIFRILFLYRLC